MKKYFVCIAVISAVMALSAISAFSQDPQAPAKDNNTAPAQEAQEAVVQPAQAVTATPAAPVAPAETAAKTNELSIYGEVQAVNVQASSISVQYYDYDNDEEKTLEVSLDKDSKLENAKAIGDVKKGDWVDVTYTVIGGKNTAKTVSVETEEPAAEDSTPVDTAEE
ncbi:MAG: hypothetical protein Q7S30_00445 [Candidatus Omnitrophota bacterium]|nr:hypothetical protein [Candidatus Omnitrophota bacterium]